MIEKEKLFVRLLKSGWKEKDYFLVEVTVSPDDKIVVENRPRRRSLD